MDNVSAVLAERGLRIERKFTQPGASPYDTVQWLKRQSVIKNPDGSVVFSMNDVEVPDFWSQTAVDVLCQKYFRKTGVPQYGNDGNLLRDESGNPLLGPEKSMRQVAHRLAGCWRYWGENYGYFASSEDAQAFYDEMVYMLIHQLGAPNSPQWFNTGLHFAYGISGKPQGHYYVDPKTGELVMSHDAYSHPQSHACFILSINDDLVNEGGIMDFVVREARIFKLGSGSGANFSDIRGRGEPLSGGGKSSGLMSFLKIFDTVAGSIKSGGTTRRASKMVLLDMDHPEIEDFIKWKYNEEKKVAALVREGYSADYEGEAYQTVSGQNSNNSVRVPNSFMRAVIEDSDWNLVWRTDGSVCKTLKARYLWDQIARAAWACADPGLQFDDTINDWHTCPASGRQRATNPCSEFSFLDNTACNLASLNLMKFFGAERAVFDIDSFRHAVRLWAIVLEISVLMAQYPSREIAKGSYDFRSLGLGITNLGAMLMVAGIPYDSDKGRAMAAAICGIMTGETYAASAELASALGPFPEYEKNKEHMFRVIRNHRRDVYNAQPEEYEQLSVIPQGLDHKNCPEYLMKAAIESWDRALMLGERYGYRNAQVTLIAPTGTISFAMDCDTTGIEPDFSIVKFKKLAGGGHFKIVNQSVEQALRNLDYSENQIADILRYVLGTNSLKGSPYINEATLREKGFTNDEIIRIEKSLPSLMDIRYAFSPAVLSDACIKRLGLSVREGSVLESLGFDRHEIDATSDFVFGTMTMEGAPHLSEEHLPVFDCASRCGRRGKRFIHPFAHMKVMAAVQPFLSGAISKTINMPNETTEEEIKELYMQSWRLGLKSIAIYRDGSKMSQPLMALMESRKKEEYKPRRKRLPEERSSITHKFRVGNQEGYITAGLYPEGAPGEIFIIMSKQGSIIAGLMDSFATTVSISLQYGVPLKVLANKFINMRFDPSGFTDNPDIRTAKSVMDYIFRWLSLKFLPREDQLILGLISEYEQPENNESNASAHITPPKIDLSQESVISFVKEEKTDSYKTELQKSSKADSDAPLCYICGTLMVRSGTCFTCPNCGANSGCS